MVSSRFPTQSGSLLLVLVLAASAPLAALEIEATVAAGPSARRGTPVFVDVAAPPGAGAVAVTAGAETLPAQIESLGGGQARVWWVVPELAAGESRTYTVTTREDAVKRAGTGAAFAWRESSGTHGKSLDLLAADRPALRYAYTPFQHDDVELTKKPFHHVYTPDGGRLLTKGPGGLYPHHRGLYFGYNRCEVAGGATYDTWHAHKGEHQLHERVVAQSEGPVRGGHVVKILWNDPSGKPFAEEERAVHAFTQAAGELLVEFTTTLRAVAGPVKLGGDRQHAGVQFRAAQEVADDQKATRYLRPAKCAALPEDQEVNSAEHRGLPWNALRFPLAGKTYTVAYLCDPANPAGAEFSERLYGRFGDFVPWDLRADHPLRLRYRLWITDRPDVSREDVERKHADLAAPPRVATATK